MTSRPPGVRFTDVIDEEETAEPWSRPCAGYPPRSSSRSRCAERGADASHRGGNPGFVRVLDASRLAWPDYSGNRMFQTLGNLARDGRAGLLFIDFDTGRTLQLTGRATVDWDEERARGFAGAERVVDFEIDRVVEIGGRAELRYRLLGRSPFNPE